MCSMNDRHHLKYPSRMIDRASRQAILKKVIAREIELYIFQLVEIQNNFLVPIVGLTSNLIEFISRCIAY